MKKHVKSAAQRAVFMGVSIGVFMLVFSRLLENPVLLASFAASLFIIFGHPKARLSCPKMIIGSHLIAATVGYGFTFIPVGNIVITGALAVGIATFLMLFFRVGHPPAAATALSFSYHVGGLDSGMTFLVALVMILALGVVRGIWHLVDDMLLELEEDVGVKKR